jgi:hypothetical protein
MRQLVDTLGARGEQRAAQQLLHQIQEANRGIKRNVAARATSSRK